MQLLFAEPVSPLGSVPCDSSSLSSSSLSKFSSSSPSSSSELLPSAVNCTASPSLCGSSCLARQLNTTLVVGGVEDHPCPATEPGCPSDGDGRQLFNVALAFGPDGALLAKYRKVHLFTLCKGCFDQPAAPDHVTFALPDGTVFGLFICFDIIFKEPSQGLYAQGVRHFAFPTSFVNIPPLLDATMIQQSWSRRFAPSSLIAANNGHTALKSGSGIYVSGEPLAQFFNPEPPSDAADEKFMLAEIPRILNGTVATAVTTATMTSASNVPVAGAAVEVEDVVVPCGRIGLKRLHCKGFESAPGASGSISASYGDLTCNLNYTFAPNATKVPFMFTCTCTCADSVQIETHAQVLQHGYGHVNAHMNRHVCRNAKTHVCEGRVVRSPGLLRLLLADHRHLC